jgi:hypothetical protein
MRAFGFVCGVAAIALFGAAAGSALAFGAIGAAAEPSRTIVVHPGDDVNAAIGRAQAGDTVAMSAGSYRGPIEVDKPITLSATQATVSAAGEEPAIAVSAGGATVVSLVATCSDARVPSRGIQVTARQVRVVGTTVLQCTVGVTLTSAADAYLQGDTVVGGRSSGSSTMGVLATDSDGLTMLGNTFAEDDTGVLVEGTTAAMLDSNSFSRIGTAVALRSVTETVLNSTQVTAASGPAVLVSGSRGAEIARLDPAGDGSGSAAAIELSAENGPSSVVDIEDSTLSHFATGIRVDTDSLTDAVTVIGTRFDGVKDAAITVAPMPGGAVDATIGDYFGGCGPRAPDHGYDGGGATVEDPDRVVSYPKNDCRPPAATTAEPPVAAAAPQAPSDPAPGARADHGGDTASGLDLSSAVGSVLVTAGVSLLLAVCAAGVLYAVRRSRHVH